MRSRVKPRVKRPKFWFSIDEAAHLASIELKRRVPPATIHTWLHRDLILGGRGWVDGYYFDHFIIHIKLGDPPMIAARLAKRFDLVKTSRSFVMPEESSCWYCHLGRQSTGPAHLEQG